MITPDDKPLLLNLDDSAKLLGICKNTVYKLLRDGDLASLKIGAKRMIPRQEIDRFIHERSGRRSTSQPETAP